MTRLRRPAGWLATGALALAISGHAAGLLSQGALDQVGIVALGWVVWSLARLQGLGTGPAFTLAAALAGGMAVLRLVLDELVCVPYLLVAPANFAVAWLFAGSLRPGREPLLLRLVRLMGVSPADDPPFRRFITRQCVLWAALSFATGCVALAAVFMVASQPWLAQLLAWLLAAQVLWFVLSHHYASIRYGRPEGWWTTARAMTRRDIWSRLRAG